MTTSLGALLEEITQRQHLEAVYETLLCDLERYLPGDVDDAFEEITVADCRVPVVGQGAIEHVYAQITELREANHTALDTLLNCEVSIVTATTTPTIDTEEEIDET